MKYPPKRLPKRQGVRFTPIDFRATSCVIDLVLLNLSSEGMAIETRRSLRVGATYPFKIRRGRRAVEIDGVVLWCKLHGMIDIGGGESQAVYRAGISFSRRLDDFEPLRSDERQAWEELDWVPLTSRSGTTVQHRSSVTCPTCCVPGVRGARRCQICGTILPQS